MLSRLGGKFAAGQEDGRPATKSHFVSGLAPRREVRIGRAAENPSTILETCGTAQGSDRQAYAPALWSTIAFGLAAQSHGRI